MKSKISIILFTALILSITGYGQSLLSKKIDITLANIVKPNEPGFSVGVVKNGKFIYTKGFGLADIRTKRKNTPETPFNIASNSKQITAACIYLLEQQDKLKTTDKLSKYFKGWPKYADSITIDHLLHHESGLMDIATLRGLMSIGNFKRNKTDYQLLVAQKHLNFIPGKDNSYSNSGYFLLALIVKKLSKQDLSIFAKQNIFKPLKMNNTGFSRSHQVKGKANGYILENNKYVINNPTDTTIGQSNVYSTIIDWNKWLLEMKKHKVLGNKIWMKMLTVADSNNKYGGGLGIGLKEGKPLVAHGGDIDGYHSNAYYFPNEDLGFIIFSNKDNISIKDVFERTYAVLKNKFAETNKVVEQNSYIKKTNIPFDTLKYLGAYRLTPGIVFTISNKNHLLTVNQLWNGFNYGLTQKSANVFYEPSDTSVTFEFKNLENDVAQNLEIFQDGEKSILNRVNLNLNLNEYCGSFFNNELETTYHFILKNNILEFSSDKEPLKLKQLDIDYFKCDYGKITFTRDLKNMINGFTLNHIRVKNLQFAKIKD